MARLTHIHGYTSASRVHSAKTMVGRRLRKLQRNRKQFDREENQLIHNGDQEDAHARLHIGIRSSFYKDNGLETAAPQSR
jgi:hypothetical protein